MQNEETPTISQVEHLYKIQFREKEQIFSVSSTLQGLKPGEVVMVQTDQNLEPAKVIGAGGQLNPEDGVKTNHVIQRQASNDEIIKYQRLIEREVEAFQYCQKNIVKHKLSMKLIRVERFFNGSKIIFYFTAENRVDFRQLVKDLVQEFRTRVEMRQIGVRHETKMVGGLGCCGRELCCSSHINNFAPVSIKMAKEQNLPLNPVKISGICNRLLCCLTYEYSTYREIRKALPRTGKKITIEGKNFKVLKQNVLDESVTLAGQDSNEPLVTLTLEEWEAHENKKTGAKSQKQVRSRKKNPLKPDQASKGRKK